MTPDERASARGHKLGKVDEAGRFAVRTCKKCGLRLVVSDDNPAGFGGSLENDCSRMPDGDAA